MNILLLLGVVVAAFFGGFAITGVIGGIDAVNLPEDIRPDDINTEEGDKIIDVPYIYQKHGFPNGCEPVSAVMILWHYGIDIDVNEFVDGYLSMGPIPKVDGEGPDPSEIFCGDPREKSGWGCYAPVITDALTKLLDGSGYTVEEHHGMTLQALCEEYIDEGIPVMVWATVDMIDSSGEKYLARWTTPEGKEIVYNRKLHCLVLVGYDEENYYFNDSLKRGKDGSSYVVYPKEKTEKAYRLLDRQAIAISLPQNGDV